MGITYEPTTYRLFLDPDGGVDTHFTLDEITLAFPSYCTRRDNNVFSFNGSLIVCGSSSARAILTCKNQTLYFSGGTLGNFGGELRMGELATVDEIPRNGCNVVYNGWYASHGIDPYQKSSDRADNTRQFPLCHQNGRVFMYNTQYKVSDQNYVRNDMLDVNANANEVDIRDCIFDGDTENGALTSYTHLMSPNVYLEDTRIIGFGVFEVGASTVKEWKGVAHTIGDMGLSAFQASIGNPVKLFGLKLRQQTYFGKRPPNSYAELTNLDYKGSYNFQAYSGNYYGIWKLLYTVDATSVGNGALLENVRNAMTDKNDAVTFDTLSDAQGAIPQQRAIAYVAEEGVNGFNVNNNPFAFRAWKYGKKAVEIPTTLNSAYVASASMIDNPFITMTEVDAQAVTMSMEKILALQLVANGDFDTTTMTVDSSGVLEDVWYTTNGSDNFISAGVLNMRRNGSVPWNGGAIVYQNFTAVIGVKYTIEVKVNAMGGASQFRFGLASFNDYIITSTGSYQYQFTATKTDYKLMVNTDPGTYTAFTQIEFFKIYDPLTMAPRFTDADSNEYTYKVDCLGNSVNDIYHKLAHLWSQTSVSTDPHYPLSTATAEGLTTPDGIAFNGGKGILFVNYLGSLKTMTADNGTVYAFPVTINITAPSLIDGTRVQIYNETKAVEVNNSLVSGSGGYMFTTQTGVAFNIEVGDTLRLRACWQSGTQAKLPITAIGAVSASGTTFLNTQVDDEQHNALGFDGSLVDLDNSPSTGEIKADYANLQIDVNDPDNIFDCRKAIAWWRYITTTQTGIALYKVEAMNYNPDVRNLLIDSSSLQIENIKAETLTITEGLWVKKDGGSIIASTSNTVIWIPNDRIYQGLETGTSGLTDTESTKLNSLDTTNLDIAVSTRASQSSLDAKATGGLTTSESTKLNSLDTTNLDVAVSTRASQSSLDAKATGLTVAESTKLNSLDTTNLDTAISTRASQASLDAKATGLTTAENTKLNSLDTANLATQASVNNIPANVWDEVI